MHKDLANPSPRKLIWLLKQFVLQRTNEHLPFRLVELLVRRKVLHFLESLREEFDVVLVQALEGESEPVERLQLVEVDLGHLGGVLQLSQVFI